jgi:hypothetical protein
VPIAHVPAELPKGASKALAEAIASGSVFIPSSSRGLDPMNPTVYCAQSTKHAKDPIDPPVTHVALGGERSDGTRMAVFGCAPCAAMHNAMKGRPRSSRAFPIGKVPPDLLT